MKALTESWKKAFDARIRTATLTRRRPAKTPTGTGAKRP
jgi:hypothetical protein